MEQRIGVAMPVMQSPQTPPQENGDEEVLFCIRWRACCCNRGRFTLQGAIAPIAETMS